jgi:hypothetical protein
MCNESAHSVRVLNQELGGNNRTRGCAKDGNSFSGQVADQSAGVCGIRREPVVKVLCANVLAPRVTSAVVADYREAAREMFGYVVEDSPTAICTRNAEQQRPTTKGVVVQLCIGKFEERHCSKANRGVNIYALRGSKL